MYQALIDKFALKVEKGQFTLYKTFFVEIQNSELQLNRK